MKNITYEFQLNIAICDDEAYYRDEIYKNIERQLVQIGWEHYHIDSYERGTELLAYIQQGTSYDVLFLDISMPGENGMELAKQIRTKLPDSILIFITSYIEFAPDGYQLNAFRYLLKSRMSRDIEEAIPSVLSKLKLKKQTLTFEFVEGSESISIANLYYIESRRHVSVFFVQDTEITPQTQSPGKTGCPFREYTIYQKLDELEELLEPYRFLRIHKSFLVNYRHMKAIRNYQAYLDHGEVLSIPKERFSKVKERFYELKGDLS